MNAKLRDWLVAEGRDLGLGPGELEWAASAHRSQSAERTDRPTASCAGEDRGRRIVLVHGDIADPGAAAGDEPRVHHCSPRRRASVTRLFV